MSRKTESEAIREFSLTCRMKRTEKDLLIPLGKLFYLSKENRALVASGLHGNLGKGYSEYACNKD